MTLHVWGLKRYIWNITTIHNNAAGISPLFLVYTTQPGLNKLSWLSHFILLNLFGFVVNNNTKCISNVPNPSMTIHVWGLKALYMKHYNNTQPNLIMHCPSPASTHARTRTPKPTYTQSRNPSRPPPPSLPVSLSLIRFCCWCWWWWWWCFLFVFVCLFFRFG